jgi:hypothetical protein
MTNDPMKQAYDPARLVAEFDLLIARAGLRIPAGHRGPMLVEFAQLRAEMDRVHRRVNAAPLVNLLLPITEGRVEG